MCAGEIPHVGDFVMVRGWCFEIMHADDKKILQVSVERLVGAFSDAPDDDDDDGDHGGPLRQFLKRNLGGEESPQASDSDVDDELERARVDNGDSAREVERMVESSKTKIELASEALSEIEKK